MNLKKIGLEHLITNPLERLKNNHFLFLVFLSILVLPYLVWLGLGEDSFVLIHDNLDSEFVYLKFLLESGELFSLSSDASIEQVMNGIQRNAFRSGYNITFLIYSFLPPIYSYITHHMLVHLIGFIGMYLVLERYVVEKKQQWISVVVAFLFALVPFYHTQYGISISGQPLLLFAFLNLLHDKNRQVSWLIIVLFPFFSFLAVTLPFFLPFLIAIGLIHYQKHQRVNYPFAFSILFFIFFSIIAEYPLVKSTISESNFISHRQEWNSFKLRGFGPSLRNSINILKTNLLNTQYHAGAMSTIPVLLVLSLVVFMRKKLRDSSFYTVICLGLILIWLFINEWIRFYFQDDFSLLKTFNTERFYFLAPFLWLVLFASLLSSLDFKNTLVKLFIIVAVGFQLISTLIKNDELVQNTKILLGRKINLPTFKQYYAADLFHQLNKNIGKPQNEYKIVSVGLFPNIAQFNGFSTLDSYQNNYSLSFKKDFRKVIAPELRKNEQLRKYFDYWGSRCYTFSAELGQNYLFSKKSSKRIKNFEIKTENLAELGCDYIISAVPIENYSAIGLTFKRSFESEASFWRIHLYQINN